MTGSALHLTGVYEDMRNKQKQLCRPAVDGVDLLLEAPSAFRGAEAPIGLYPGGPFGWPCPLLAGADGAGVDEEGVVAASLVF